MNDGIDYYTGSAFPLIKKRPYTQYFTFAKDGDFPLDSGRLFGPITLAYETYGRLNSERSNAVLIVHALTGDAHCASHGEDDPEKGWWEPLVGPGKVFDTRRYFVICSNVLGGCQGSTGPASYDPQTGKPYGMRFPVITIRDMVRAQKQLIDHLGIKRLHCVTGGSMGGAQTLTWAVEYPDMMDGIIAIAMPGRSSAQSIAYNEVMRRAIVTDPAWNGGDYYGTPGPINGLATARMLGMITYQSDESMTMKFGRDVMNATFADLFDFRTQFQVESYLHYQGRKLVERFDANTYLYLTRAIDLFDISLGYPSYDAALGQIKCLVQVIGVSSDILYPRQQQIEIARILKEQGKDVRYDEIESIYGHDGFLIEFDKMVPMLNTFLERLWKIRHGGNNNNYNKHSKERRGKKGEAAAGGAAEAEASVPATSAATD
ncbi:MAG TPA: homoserine O-acetyltransferase [Firmicutes bacterium]|nr:homoserine O-acetyltransferase [Bacillota bacterium]